MGALISRRGFGGFLTIVWYDIPPNPNLILKVKAGSGFRV